jgi:uncharacterized protein YjbJ (UPF0337 family)
VVLVAGDGEWAVGAKSAAEVEGSAQSKEGQMDAGHILVAVLIAAALGWLVWVELHCRRNRAEQITGGTPERVDGITGGCEQVRNGGPEGLSGKVRTETGQRDKTHRRATGN